jgi:hypothetical protein
MRILDVVHRTLDDAGVPHALIGAAALAAHGVARSTFDLDILVVDQRCLDDAFWADVRSRRFAVDVRRGDSDDPLAGVVRIEQAGDRPVDVVVGRHVWQQRAIQRSVAQHEAPAVLLASDLVLLKLYAGGTQDMWDIDQMLSLPDAEQLVDAVQADVGDLPSDARRRWNEIITGRRGRFQ